MIQPKRLQNVRHPLRPDQEDGVLTGGVNDISDEELERTVETYLYMRDLQNL